MLQPCLVRFELRHVHHNKGICKNPQATIPCPLHPIPPSDVAAYTTTTRTNGVRQCTNAVHESSAQLGITQHSTARVGCAALLFAHVGRRAQRPTSSTAINLFPSCHHSSDQIFKLYHTGRVLSTCPLARVHSLTPHPNLSHQNGCPG